MAKSIGSLMAELIEAAKQSPLGLETEVIISVPPEQEEGTFDLKTIGLRGDKNVHAIEFTME